MRTADLANLGSATKLNANKYLKISRVSLYVVNKLNLKLEADIDPAEYIEILCNNQVCFLNLNNISANLI